MKKNKKIKGILVILILAITFFTATLTITWDSAHYLSYVDIFEKVKPFSSWDIVRGPVFPLILFISDLIFGKSAIGMLMMMFIFYLLYFYVIYVISKEMFKNLKHKKIYNYIFLIFSVFNPLIFGYFHTLLTEFLAILIMLLSCYISWKWIYIKKRKDKIIYCIYYVILLSFSYFLKQPYICAVMFPLLIGMIISFFYNHKLKNIIYRLSTLLLSIIVLFISIISWNKILDIKGVNMDTGRDSSSLFSSQLISSVSNLKVLKINSYDQVKHNKTLTKKEKNNIKNLLNKGKKISLIKIYDNKKLKESDFILVDKNGNSSIFDSIKEIMKFSVKYPNLSAQAYSKNYCALSSVCVIKTIDGVGYWVSDKKDYVNLFENNVIAYRTFQQKENLFYLSSEKYDSAKYYTQTTSLSITSKIIKKLSLITNIIYKFSILLLPLFTIIMLLFGFIKRKKISDWKFYSFSIMFLIASFLTTCCCAIIGQIIDRYAVYCFISSLIGIISACIFINNNKNVFFKKRKDENYE